MSELEKGDRFKMNIVNCAMIGAFILSMSKRPDAERLTVYCANAMMTKSMKASASAKISFTGRDGEAGSAATATLSGFC